MLYYLFVSTSISAADSIYLKGQENIDQPLEYKNSISFNQMNNNSARYLYWDTKSNQLTLWEVFPVGCETHKYSTSNIPCNLFISSKSLYPKHSENSKYKPTHIREIGIPWQDG